MKTVKFTLIALFAIFFSGCAYTDQLESQNMRQATIIQQQQQEVEKLEKALQVYKEQEQAKKQAVENKKNARKRWIEKQKKLKKEKNLQNPVLGKKKKPVKTSKRPTINNTTVDKNGLRKVEDTNYSSNYMYPKAKKKTTPKVLTSTTTIMTKAECISMITQARFDKYTQMFGSEAASIKRCRMLKAMR